VFQDFERDGFAIVEQALTPGELEAVRKAVDRTWAELGGGTVHELAFLPHDPIFLELIDHPATLPIVAGLLAGTSTCITATSTYIRPLRTLTLSGAGIRTGGARISSSSLPVRGSRSRSPTF
jgi:hypothetical protein